MKSLLLTVALLASGSPALAAPGASKFTLVNGTNAPLAELSIRRAGTQDWRPLAPASAPAGAKAAVDFKDPDCAFDIQATLQGVGPVVWSGVNLCEVKTVILNRNASGAIWVDYE